MKTQTKSHAKAQVVSFHCTLRNTLGEVLSSTYNRDVITYMGKDKVPAPLQGLVEGLQDLKIGQRRSIPVSAEKAFGFYDPELVSKVRRKSVPSSEQLRVGDSIQVQVDEFQIRLYKVIEIDADSIVLDANHPLAGQDLVFDIEATEVRDATHEEIAESVQEKKLSRFLH
jgi:FKBP-type peptidyl-prolyl cis-trans isomerase SlyD